MLISGRYFDLGGLSIAESHCMGVPVRLNNIKIDCPDGLIIEELIQIGITEPHRVRNHTDG
jgi:hypothetical protein